MCFCRQRKILYFSSRLTAMTTVTITIDSSLHWWWSPCVVWHAHNGWKGSLRKAVPFCADQKTGFLRGWDLPRSPQTGVAALRLEPDLWLSDPCILTPRQMPSTLAPRILRPTLVSSSCHPADHWGRFRGVGGTVISPRSHNQHEQRWLGQPRINKVADNGYRA